MKYKKHVFICTNQREDGRECCGEQRGMELVEKFKQLVKKNRLNHEIRSQRAGCFDTCSFGPTMVVYPEGVFYKYVTPEDVNEIFEEHLINNRPVERLRIHFNEKI